MRPPARRRRGPGGRRCCAARPPSACPTRCWPPPRSCRSGRPAGRSAWPPRAEAAGGHRGRRGPTRLGGAAGRGRRGRRPQLVGCADHRRHRRARHHLGLRRHRSAGPAADQLELIALYANHAAASIERERLFAEAQRRNRVLEAIRAVLEALAGPSTSTPGLDAALGALCDVLGGRRRAVRVASTAGDDEPATRGRGRRAWPGSDATADARGLADACGHAPAGLGARDGAATSWPFRSDARRAGRRWPCWWARRGGQAEGGGRGARRRRPLAEPGASSARSWRPRTAEAAGPAPVAAAAARRSCPASATSCAPRSPPSTAASTRCASPTSTGREAEQARFLGHDRARVRPHAPAGRRPARRVGHRRRHPPARPRLVRPGPGARRLGGLRGARSRRDRVAPRRRRGWARCGPTTTGSSRCSSTCSTTPCATPRTAPPSTVGRGRPTTAATVEVRRAATTGPGFAPGLAATCSSPTSPAPRRGGHGLGLAIARGIADAHGGDARPRPARPTGATFVVTLPIAPTDTPRGRAGRPPTRDGRRTA